MVFAHTIQEKRRDLSRSSYIWYRQTPRENELRNKYPTLSYIPCEVQRGLYTCGIYKQNERRIVPTLLVEIGDFDVRDKARNAFLTRGFLPSGNAKVVN